MRDRGWASVRGVRDRVWESGRRASVRGVRDRGWGSMRGMRERGWERGRWAGVVRGARERRESGRWMDVRERGG